MVSHFLNLLKKRFNFTSANKGLSTGRQGFTLIELIVSVGIMITITTVILANYATFNKRIRLEGASQEIASVVREAQAYGVSKKITSVSGAVSYGVNFDINYPGRVIVFSDNDDGGSYTAGEEVEIFNIQSSDRIKQICVNQKIIFPPPCPGAGSANVIDVIYKRSNIYADITSNPVQPFISDAEIMFRSAGESANGVKVIVWKSGQVSVEAE